MATTKMDLDRDFNINGVQYNKGKDVEVQSEHTEAIKDLTAGNDAHLDWASTHHGAVPQPNDPMEATAQTPTRPLGGEHVQQPTQVKPVVNTGDVVKVADPNEGKEAATEIAKKADTVDAGSGEVK